MGSIVRVSFLMLLFVVGVLVGCSFVETGQDYALKPYVTKFYGDMGINPKTRDKYAVRFSSLSHQNNVIGRCYRGMGIIDIDPAYWYSASERRRLSLIYHELAHCVCSLNHTDDIEEHGFCPESIMHSESIPDVCLEIKWDKYIKDLRKECE